MISNVFRSVSTLAKVGAIAALVASAGMAVAAEPMADEAIVEQMTQAGMTDVVVSHQDGKINVAGTLDGQGTELVYNAESGALETFNSGSPDTEAHVKFLHLGEAPTEAPAN